MKICEVIPKTIKPLTTQQMMIRNLKQNIENSRKRLQAEKDRQRKAKEMERQKRIMNYG
jgi:predicted alpha/beta-fold hydrolase